MRVVNTFARRVLIVLILIGVFAICWFAAYVLLLAFAGVLGAIILDAITRWLRKRTGLSHGKAYLIVLLVLLGAIVVAIWQLAPRLIVQVSQLVQVIPKAVTNLRNTLNQYPWGRTLVGGAPPSFDFLGLLGTVTNIAFKVVEGVGSVIVVAVVAAYVAGNPQPYRSGLLSLFPEHARGRAADVFKETANTLRHWMLGQLVPMVVLGIATGIGLWLLGIPLVFTLALFTGLMIFIPYVGSFIAFLLTLLVTLSQDPGKVIYVAVFFLAVHIAEGYILTPLVQKKAVYLPPALTILAQVLMAALLGFLGLALATPMAAAGLVLVRMLYLHENPSPGT